jgi:hypothetical protein
LCSNFAGIKVPGAVDDGDYPDTFHVYSKEHAARFHIDFPEFRVVVTSQEFAHVREPPEGFDGALDPCDEAIGSHRAM